MIVGYPRYNNDKLMNSAALIYKGKISIIDKIDNWIEESYA